MDPKELYSFSRLKRDTQDPQWHIFYSSHTERFRELHRAFEVKETDPNDINYWYNWLRYSITLSDACLQAMRDEALKYRIHEMSNAVVNEIANLPEHSYVGLFGEVLTMHVSEMQRLDEAAQKLQKEYLQVTGRGEAGGHFFANSTMEMRENLAKTPRRKLAENRAAHRVQMEEVDMLLGHVEELCKAVDARLPNPDVKPSSSMCVAHALATAFAAQARGCLYELKNRMPDFDLPPIKDTPPSASRGGRG